MRQFARRLTACLLLSAFFAGATFALTIEGRVVNSATNEPVPGADVSLACINTEKQNRFCQNKTGKTSAEGTFSFDRLSPVKYLLTAVGAPGLASTRKSQIEVTLDYKSTLVDTVLKLEPECAISGKVVDEDGRPHGGMELVLFKQIASGSAAGLAPVSKLLSDKAGTYIFQRLGPGNYYVAATIVKRDATLPKTQPPDIFFIYAPSATNLENAVATHLEVGQTSSDIDVHVRPLILYRLQGKAQMDPAEQIVSGELELRLYSRDNSGVTAPNRQIQLNPNGTFQANVLAGAYTLRLTGTTVPSLQITPKSPAPMTFHLLAKQEIEISGKDLYGILLLMPPPFTITGRVDLEGEPDRKVDKPDVSLRPMDLAAASACQTITTQADSTFTIANCDAANYSVHFVPPAGAYVKAITFDEQDAMTHPIDLSRSLGGELRIVVRLGASSVTATVGDAGASGPIDVVLIPDSWVENQMVPIIHTAKQNGQFAATGLTPGHYSAVAAAGVEPRFWEYTAFVHQAQMHGTPFDLGENEQKQVVAAQLTEDDAEQIELRLGLY